MRWRWRLECFPSTDIIYTYVSLVHRVLCAILSLEIYKPKVLTEINFCLLIVFILFDRCTHYISGYYKWIVARYVWVCNRIAFTCLKSVAGKNIDLSYKAGLQINVTTCINFKCLQNCKKYLSNIVVSLLRLLVSLYDSIVNDE